MPKHDIPGLTETFYGLDLSMTRFNSAVYASTVGNALERGQVRIIGNSWLVVAQGERGKQGGYGSPAKL